MDGRTKLEKLLKEKGYSVTKPRLRIFNFLHETSEPLAVTELAKSLDDVDKVSVYRTVDLFEAAGIVHRVWTGFKSRVELSEEFSPHHHHFTCVNCGKIISLQSEELEKGLKRLEDKNGFNLTHHSIELSGHCEDCHR